MAFLKQLVAKGPESIDAEKVVIKEFPLQELCLTFFYTLIAAFWLVFCEDIVDWIMGVEINSPIVQTLRGINFVATSSLVLYMILRRAARRRRQALEALRLSQQRFEAVALATTDSIWDLNLETRVVWWSEGIQKLFGYRAEDVSSKFDWWVQRLHPDDRERVTESVRAVAESGGRTWTGEYRFRRHDGTYALVWDRGFIIRDATGKPTRLIGGMSDISERRLAEQALENSRQQLRALTARLQTGREEERAAVAREIHDDLGQILTALKLNLDRIERDISNHRDASSLNPLLELIVETGDMVEQAIQTVQRIATELRPAMLDNLGLVEALAEEARRFQERTGTNCDLRLPEQAMELPPEASIAVFRVFQEGLTNVARHANATVVRALLELRNSRIVLELEDNGRGIPADALTDPGSLGLLGMAERAAALGGQVAVAPISPNGTRVTLQLPLKSSNSAALENA